MTRRGFTLLEVIVVLVVMGLTAALVAPALLPPKEPSASLQGVIRHTQNLALRRAETILLEVSSEGRWHTIGTSSAQDGPLSNGVLNEDAPPSDLALSVAPSGSCAWRLDPGAARPRPPLDPLTCRVSVP
jgi:prepilin-type N-terminal cleavage/methylation domain-containing protein